jgi:hypothetical protein
LPTPEEHLDQVRAYLTDEAEDDLAYLTPNRPSDLANLTDLEIWRLYRKMGYANQHPFDRIIEHEMRGRLIAALNGFRESSEKTSQRLEALTWALVVLTIVIAIFTVALFFAD